MRFYQSAALICILLSSAAQAGHVVYNNLWSRYDVIQGFGQTMAEAMTDASSAKPVGYILDPGNSWATWEMHKGDWMATRPIIKSDTINAQTNQIKVP